MATHLLSRSLLSKMPPFSSKTLISSLLSRSFSSSCRPSSLLRSAVRPLSSAAARNHGSGLPSFRAFSTQTTSSSLNDPNPNWSNRPPKETILLDGCDFEHWLVVVDKPEGDPTRDEIIDSYIKTLAKVVGSEEEARKKIYSVSTRCYYAFGALVSEEVSYKIKELPGVRWVLPDSYLDVKNKDYGGEPFIDGKAVPYDPKYHEEWIRNNARANERNRRNMDRPRNFERRNFDRRRENMQNRDFQNQHAGPPNSPPMPNQGTQNAAPNSPPNNYGPPPSNNYGPPPPPSNNYRPPPPPPNNYRPPPPPPNNFGPPPPNNFGPPPSNNYGPPPSNNFGPPPPNNYGPPPPNNYGPPPPNNQMNRQPDYQNNYAPNRDGNMPY